MEAMKIMEHKTNTTTTKSRHSIDRLKEKASKKLILPTKIDTSYTNKYYEETNREIQMDNSGWKWPLQV